MDAQRPYRGHGPKGYKRSDERIKEDINDRLSEGYFDATEIDEILALRILTLTDEEKDEIRASSGVVPRAMAM